MVLRVVALVACLVGILCSAPSLLAQPDAPLMCCSKTGECGGFNCCDWSAVADEPCSPDDQGYCQALCIRTSDVR